MVESFTEGVILVSGRTPIFNGYTITDMRIWSPRTLSGIRRIDCVFGNTRKDRSIE
jgi:hypothetical protein